MRDMKLLLAKGGSLLLRSEVGWVRIPTINQTNTTIFEHNLKEIKTDQMVLTLVQLCHPKVSKCYGCGTFLKLNNVIPETPNDLVFVSNTLREYKEEGQIKFSQYPQNVYIKVHNPDSYAYLRKKFNFHVEAIKLHDQALLELKITHFAKILYDCKLVQSEHHKIKYFVFDFIKGSVMLLKKTTTCYRFNVKHSL